MALTLHSESPAVTQTLHDIVTAALGDMPPLHSIRIADGQVHITDEHGHLLQLPCPIHPFALSQHLGEYITTAPANHLAHGWRLDVSSRTLHHAQHSLSLTEKEALLLHMLLLAFPAACGREHLLREVWAYDASIETHTLETHIYRLRQKLETLQPRPCDILTVEGAYQLDIPLA